MADDPMAMGRSSSRGHAASGPRGSLRDGDRGWRRIRDVGTGRAAGGGTNGRIRRNRVAPIARVAESVPHGATDRVEPREEIDMNEQNSQRPFRPHRGQRVAIAAAGFAASVFVMVSTGWLFGQASSTPWLPDTAQARALAAPCLQASSPAAHDRCMSQALAQWQSAQRGDLRLADALP
jgi:hypothetical protein